MKRIYSVAEYAAEMDVAEDVLEDAIADGDVEVHHASGRRLILAEDVDEEVVEELREASEIEPADDDDDHDDDDAADDGSADGGGAEADGD